MASASPPASPLAPGTLPASPPVPGTLPDAPPATDARPDPADDAAAGGSAGDPTAAPPAPGVPGASAQQGHDGGSGNDAAGGPGDGAVDGPGSAPEQQRADGDHGASSAPEQQDGGGGDTGSAPAQIAIEEDTTATATATAAAPAAAASSGDAPGTATDAVDGAPDASAGAGAPTPAPASRSRSTSPAAPAAKRLKPDPDGASPPQPGSSSAGPADASLDTPTKERYPAAADEPNAAMAVGSAAPSVGSAAPSAAAAAADEELPMPRLSPEAETGLADIFKTGACSASDVNGRVREYLASLPDATARAAIDDLATRDFSSVRNRPAFVMSCVKKAAAAALPVGAPGAASSSAGATASVPPSALAHLPGPVGEGLQRVFATGVCHPSQFDDRAMDILVELPTHAAVRALSEFAAVPPSRVRNPSAFWMGLARKHKSAVAAAALAPQTMPNMNYGPPPMAQGYGTPQQPYGQPMHHQPPPSYDYHQVHQQPAYGGYDYGPQYGHGGYGPPAPVVGGGVPGGGYYDARPPPVASSMGGVAPGYAVPGGSRVASRVDALVAARVVRPGDVDARAIEALGRLREADALAALDELAAAEPSRVRNPSAYVMGLARKYAAASAAAYPNADGPDGGGAGGGMANHGGGAGAGPAGGGPSIAGGGLWNTMDARVREKYESLVASGVLPSVAFDSRAVAALAGLSPADGIASLDELAASDPTRVRNLSAYYMGVARKFAARMPEGR